MIFAVAGSQGSGKTTVIRGLGDRGYNVVERKTARSVLEDWGVTLDEVNQQLNLKMDFQEELLRRKIADDLQKDSYEINFTERSFADLFTYALVNIGQYNECSSWLDDYFTACAKAQNHYDGIFYIKSGFFQVQNDGVRSINQHYSEVYDLALKHFTHKLAYVPVIEVDLSDVEKRIDFIEHNAINITKAAQGIY